MNLVRLTDGVWVNPEAVIAVVRSTAHDLLTDVHLDTGEKVVVEHMDPDSVVREIAALAKAGDAEVVDAGGNVRIFR